MVHAPKLQQTLILFLHVYDSFTSPLRESYFWPLQTWHVAQLSSLY